MKRNVLMGLLGTALVATVAQNATAQGTIQINSNTQSVGLFLGNFTTSAPTSTYVELLGGASADSLSGIVTSGTGTAIFQLSTAGSGYVQAGGGLGSGSYFNAGYGNVTGVATSGTGFFQLLAWTGSSSFASATYQFESAVWSQSTGTPFVNGSPPTAANPAAMNPSFANPVIGLVSTSIPGGNNGYELVSAPEPSSLALAGLGGFGMLMAFRRKKA